MNRTPVVVSVAAVSGGGKTAVINRLLERVDYSKALYFDNYVFEGPDDLGKWAENGADYNGWDLSPLIQDVECLLTSNHLHYIFLDYPFAYLHDDMNGLIHLSIYIDTPLDIAMGRRILRDFAIGPIENVHKALINYLSSGRKAYLEMEKNVKPNSDIVIDGSMSLDTIVEQIIKKIGDFYAK
ncbi:hypothetical protein [Lentibacillus salinarum]|uniref:Phosphoribulokinase/uridine kinase domain-containing protein n=1 Tax=Lentibacillus salinarum TaxID=446820 RepID=A0ABW3ZSU6_9BACI